MIRPDRKPPYNIWAQAVYLVSTEIKGRASIKVARDLGITQKSAWFLMHRIREGYDAMISEILASGGFDGVTEIDEVAIGGRVGSMNAKSYRSFKRRGGGTGFRGKAIMIGAKNRDTSKVVTKVIDKRDRQTLLGFVDEVTKEGSTVMTDEAKGYWNMMNRTHKTVNHSKRKCATKDGVSTNNIEGHWSLMDRGRHGIYHKFSEKHLSRYGNEFSGRGNDRRKDTIEQIVLIANAMIGRRMSYADLIMPNGKRNFSRLTSVEIRFGAIKKKWNEWAQALDMFADPDVTVDLARRVNGTLKYEWMRECKALRWTDKSKVEAMRLACVDLV